MPKTPRSSATEDRISGLIQTPPADAGGSPDGLAWEVVAPVVSPARTATRDMMSWCTDETGRQTRHLVLLWPYECCEVNPTCMFTGVPLDSQTCEEHTILRALGGRIRSRTVSSSSFNARCSEVLDKRFASVYAQLMNSCR